MDDEDFLLVDSINGSRLRMRRIRDRSGPSGREVFGFTWIGFAKAR